MTFSRLPIAIVALVLLPAAPAAADTGEEAAIAECKAKSDPSILVNYWKSAATTPPAAAALADMETRAKTICTLRGGGSSGSYQISGNAGPMKVSGTACDLDKPFTVSGGGGGMTVTFSYAPGNDEGGRVSYTGGAPGAPMSGAGNYSVTADEKGGTLKQTHTGKVNIPMGGSATHTDVFQLTPIPKC